MKPAWIDRDRIAFTRMAQDSCGPVVHETPEEALARRVRHAAAHPLPERRRSTDR